MSKSYMNKIRVYLNQSNNRELKGYANDMNGAIYFSDSYSVIRLFDDSYVRKQRLEIMETFDRAKKYEHSVVEHFRKFENQNFNQFTRVVETIKEDNKVYNKYDENSKIRFDYTMILRIARIVGKNENVSIFTSKENENAICIVGQYGVAFLLGCRVY